MCQCQNKRQTLALWHIHAARSTEGGSKIVNSDAYLVKPLFSPDIERAATRDGYGEAILELGKDDPRIVVLCADLAESTRTLAFAKKFPERFIEVGVAEQNMAGIAAGLALEGKIPFMSSFAVFSPGRNWDQVRVSICYSKANVKIAGSHAGLQTGGDGATHQALEDIAITRCLPNMVVLAPCDALETKKAVFAAARHNGPVYIRLARDKTPVFTTLETPFKIGKAVMLSAGSDVTIIACGTMVYPSLEASKALLDEGISVQVVNNSSIKPIDISMIISAARDTGAVVTVEEHQIYGGLGSAVAEVLAANLPVPQEMVAVKDMFGESGEPKELWQKYGLTVENIIAHVKRAIARKKAQNG
ncbi:MAG: transketolase family protein [Firmicutes bacterium]|nr:transketolase family protein [Bacillota bacterium]